MEDTRHSFDSHPAGDASYLGHHTRGRAIVPWLLAACLLVACGPTDRPDGSLRRLAVVEPSRDGHYVVAHPLAQLALPGVPRNLLLDGPVLYAFLTQAGMATIDIGDVAAPRVSDVQPGIWGDSPDDRHMYFTGLAEPGRLLVSDRFRQALAVFDASDPLHPRPDWELPMPGEGPIDIRRIGDAFYLACGGSGLFRIPADFDRQTTVTPLLREFDTVKQSEFLPPDWLLLADNHEGGLQVLKLRDSSLPRPVHTFNTGSFVDSLVLFDGFAALANRNQGVAIIDLEDPARPFFAANFHTRENQRSTCIARWGERRAIVGASSGYFDVLDLADPRRPAWLGRISTRMFVLSLAIRGDVVFVGLAAPPSTHPDRPAWQLRIYRLEERRR
jgi:hypothetical protein